MKFNQNIVCRTVAGQSMMIPVGPLAGRCKGFVTLSESSALIFEHFKGIEFTVEDLEQFICEEYDTKDDSYRDDIRLFVRQMVLAGLIEGADAQANL